jgi:hypothetical protein
MTSTNTIPPLLRLPVELHDEITSYFHGDDEHDVLSLLCLRLTCRYFYDLIASPPHEILLRLEKRFPNLGYACKYCLRLRPESAFTDKMLANAPGHIRYCWDHMNRAKRFCTDCGSTNTERDRYARATEVIENGVVKNRCWTCNQLMDGDWSGAWICLGLCVWCWRKEGRNCSLDFATTARAARAEQKKRDRVCCEVAERAVTAEDGDGFDLGLWGSI